VIRFCDLVVRGFSNQNIILKLIRNTGLVAFETIPGFKPLVANYAMGLKA
jgi:2-octaprenyl-6-methoxyphenol hydroxylase